MKRYALKGGNNSGGTGHEASLGWIMFVPLVCCAFGSSASAQDWIEFHEQTCRIVAADSIINDIPCDDDCCSAIDPSCPMGFPRQETACFACEKDIAFGDLDGDGNTDMVIVRKFPFSNPGGKSNILLMNENGILVDKTAELAPGFMDLTDDRDVVIVDLDPIPEQVLLDVVTASTFGDPPRVYINLGCCSTSCSPSQPCPVGSEIPCAPATNWCGLQYEPQRIEPFVCFDDLGNAVTCNPPFFCGVASGDVNNDGCPDLYFVDYPCPLEVCGFDPARLHDRLLINRTDANGNCLGIFDDKTAERMCPQTFPFPDSTCFNSSNFGTMAEIVDMNSDTLDDIVKSE